VIIAIDDDSLRPDRLRRFPWLRGVYADLLDKLAEAKVVACDILFTGPDRYSPEADARFARAKRRWLRNWQSRYGGYKDVHSD